MQDIFSDQIQKQGKKMRQYNKSHVITIGSLFEPSCKFRIFDCIVKKHGGTHRITAKLQGAGKKFKYMQEVI